MTLIAYGGRGVGAANFHFTIDPLNAPCWVLHVFSSQNVPFPISKISATGVYIDQVVEDNVATYF